MLNHDMIAIKNSILQLKKFISLRSIKTELDESEIMVFERWLDMYENIIVYQPLRALAEIIRGILKSKKLVLSDKLEILFWSNYAIQTIKVFESFPKVVMLYS